MNIYIYIYIYKAITHVLSIITYVGIVKRFYQYIDLMSTLIIYFLFRKSLNLIPYFLSLIWKNRKIRMLIKVYAT